jgi:chlorobactene glucosyltransferase
VSLSYHLVITGIIGLMTLVALINIASIRRLGRRRAPRMFPLVSILLPARNEAKTIGMCLSMLTDQDYPQYEIVVLDDNSDDATADIAAQWARTDKRVRLVRGAPLPEGWVGKCFACHQLSAIARGELLLFVDADTVHTRHSVRAAVAAMEMTDAGLLTVIPHQVMRSFWEKLILPLLHFSTFCFLPLPLVRWSGNPKLAMANGQFMMFRRSVYDMIGGHKAVRSAMVEDVWLSRRVKEFGSSLSIMDGGEVVSCRMYSSFAGIWDGFSKNLFAGFSYSLPAISAMVLFNLLTSVAPFLFLPAAWGTPAFPIVAAQVLLLLVIRVALALRFRMSVWVTFLHGVAMLMLIGIALNSCRWVLAAGGARWKGRRYDFRNQPMMP